MTVESKSSDPGVTADGRQKRAGSGPRWTVSFPAGLYRRLTSFLESAEPLENGCYLTADWHAAGRVRRMLVRSAVLPDERSWNAQGKGSLNPSSRYLNRAVGEAERAGSSLLFVHTHPSSDHPPAFSGVDEATNEVFFRDMSSLLHGRPVGSAVLSRAGMHAVVHHEGRAHPAHRIEAVGSTLERADRARDGAARHSPAHARQEAMLGPVHERICGLDVCVVGAGGVGSCVAAQVARLGAGRIRLVDPDVLEESNVSRVYGSRLEQVGSHKADVVAEYMRSFSSSEVRAVRGDICDDEHLACALEADVVLCCTDNMRSRDKLNEASLRYYRPLIDVGCNVVTENRLESTAYAQSVTPETACLWCTGQMDGKRLGDELLTGEQRLAKARLGYYEPHQPSTVALTTWAACLGVDKLFSLLGLYGRGRSSVSYVDITGEFCQHRTPPVKKGCVCAEFRFD